MEDLQTNLEFIRKDLNSCGHVTEGEHRVSQAEDTLCDHSMDLHMLKVKVKSLEAQAKDSENRNRRNNLWILGLPDGTKGTNTTAFTEQCLTKLFPDARFSPFFTVERAHHISATRGPHKVPPLTFIFKLLHFQDHDLGLKES